MIPILYDIGETAFTSNGLGRLTDCISCTVTEERNGVYECEFEYPISGQMYNQIIEGRSVGCTHDDKGDIQPFDIYGRSAPIDGVVTFYAHHISYRLRNVILKPFAADSCAAALAKFETETYNNNPFTFWTDKSVDSPYKLSVPASAREMLSGVEGSILDVYGKGEYQFDKFAVRLYVNRGTDSGAKIKYGVNLADLVYDKDGSEIYNAVVPFWRSSDDGTVVMLPEIMLIGPHVPTSQIPWTTDTGEYMYTGDGQQFYWAIQDVTLMPLDMSDSFDTQPTVEQLRTAAQSRLNNSEAYQPRENIDVDFVALWQTAEYANVAPLQRLSLCDRATVEYRALGVNVTMQIIRTVYNVLENRFDKMELGNAPRTSYADAITEALEVKVLPKYASRSMLDAAVSHATDLITGGLGGYVVFNLNADGQPEEILIMDTPDIATAVNVWRFNKNGLGHSHSGYNGPFDDIALTADGQINASMITAGTLNANLIRAGVISDVAGKNSWDLLTGLLTTTSILINGGSINLTNGTYGFYVDPYGNLAIGTKPDNMTSLDGNQCAYQVTNNGRAKITELYLYGRTSASDNYIPYARFDFVGYNYGGTSYRALRISSADNSGNLVDTAYFTSAGVFIPHDFIVSGTKNRAVKTATHGTRKLYAYETAAPYFGDIGESQIDQRGRVVVPIDPIFAETIARNGYQVFLTPYGRGECFVAERGPESFTVEGTAGLRFGWEIKGKQIDYDNIRLEALNDDN